MGWIIALVLAILLTPAPLRSADIEFLTENLPWAVADRPYSPPPLQSRASGACPLQGVGYAIVAGVPPPGIQMSRLGYFSGTPVRTGSWEIGVRVSNGCTWTARHFVLVVTGAPVLTVTPEKLIFKAEPGRALSLAEALHISATWPRLRYLVTPVIAPATNGPDAPASPGSWLKIEPEQGFTPRESSALTEDAVQVRVDPSGLRPGRYFAQIVVSAWEALHAPAVAVELTITEPSSGIPTSASQ